MQFDLLLVNGNVITLEENRPKARWVGVKDGKIAAVGDGEAPAEAGQVIDLAGKTVVPGLTDSHMHGSLTGRFLAGSSVKHCRSIDELLGVVEKACKEAEGDRMVTITEVNPEMFKEKRFPTKKELDAVSFGHPVMAFHTSVHAMVLNSKCLELSRLTDYPDMIKDQYDPIVNDGFIDQDKNDQIIYKAWENLFALDSDDVLKTHMDACTESAAKAGLTGFHSLDGGELLSIGEYWVAESPKNDMHITNYYQTWDVARAKELGLPRVGGCLCLDGARAMYTAAYSEPYVDRPYTRGLLYFKDIEVHNFIYEAHKNGMQAGMHAMGDRAIDQVIYAIDSAVKQLGNADLRHRIEHYSYPTQRHMEMAVEYGLALPMQPIFCDLWDNQENSVLKRILGDERASHNEPFKKLVEMGAKVCGGSDCPVTPFNPLMGIHVLVNDYRDTRRVSVTDALKIWSYNCAWAAHEEEERGSIKEGKYADFTVLDRDPYVDSADIRNFNVEMTITEGKVLYRR